MRFAVLGILLSLALVLSGCGGLGQDPTARVDVSVYDSDGNPIQGAAVKAYSNYRLGTGANDKWLNIEGTITATDTTDTRGNGDVQIAPLLIYAITASKDGYETNGVEKQIITGNNSISITLRKSTDSQPDIKAFLGEITKMSVDSIAINKSDNRGYVVFAVPQEKSGNSFDTYTYYEDETITGLTYNNQLLGKTLYVKNIIATSPTPNYGVVLEVRDTQGVKTGTVIAYSGSNLGNVLLNTQITGKAIYNEGDTITGLTGAGMYDGEAMKMIFTGTWVATPTSNYQATLELRDSQGNIVAAITAGEGANLANPSYGDKYLKTNFQINVVGISHKTNKGYMEATRTEPTPEVGSDRGSVINKPPTITVTTGKVTYTSGETVSVTATATDPEGSLKLIDLYYTMDSGANWSHIGQCTSSPCNLSFKTTSKGTYIIAANAYGNETGKDHDGGAQKTTNITVG
ncbi:MAG: hypothetical protein HY544_01255 [Candidatus Diapherotrites archaeon]|uniref:Uncharacterized protein n=1 Tax=Candidatus Iainarchaeum sp. TaxID=3101447 RepID=A0A8T3YPM5_9ARCH|nr:hypothetical protein [Candidatus Diapherotrites archaeon]